MVSEKPTLAFVLSLVAGILITLGGGMRSMMDLWFGGFQGQGQYPYGGMMGGYNNGYNGNGWMYNMMNGWYNGGYNTYNGNGGFGWMYNMMNGYGGYGFGMMRGLGLGGGFGLMGIVGAVFGIVIIISAVMLNGRSNGHTTWGVLIIIFSALSVFGGMMSGFGLGAILGVIGGILAIVWKPSSSTALHT